MDSRATSGTITPIGSRSAPSHTAKADDTPAAMVATPMRLNQSHSTGPIWPKSPARRRSGSITARRAERSGSMVYLVRRPARMGWATLVVPSRQRNRIARTRPARRTFLARASSSVAIAAPACRPRRLGASCWTRRWTASRSRATCDRCARRARLYAVVLASRSGAAASGNVMRRIPSVFTGASNSPSRLRPRFEEERLGGFEIVDNDEDVHSFEHRVLASVGSLLIPDLRGAAWNRLHRAWSKAPGAGIARVMSCPARRRPATVASAPSSAARVFGTPLPGQGCSPLYVGGKTHPEALSRERQPRIQA